MGDLGQLGTHLGGGGGVGGGEVGATWPDAWVGVGWLGSNLGSRLVCGGDKEV